MRSFPLVRDLVVDRDRARNTLTRLPLSLPVDHAQAELMSVQSPATASELARLDTCIQCSACLEACPQYGDHSEFIGAEALHQVNLKNRMLGGERGRKRRLEGVMGPGGVGHCGKAQNCVEVCPVELPLVDSIQGVARATTRHLILGWLLE